MAVIEKEIARCNGILSSLDDDDMITAMEERIDAL